ncbi:hypothetical protein AAFF_G00116270 [Aldrovandia affinis]|uniref:Uncharacterized protein n=1 Tax=Aldrovandia affinis TaxID=143900 RepID=A0AAD7WWY5_9TELE|nr:hypothetical protein AAFF_G00116270 [Aldrovandia affinis]
MVAFPVHATDRLNICTAFHPQRLIPGKHRPKRWATTLAANRVKRHPRANHELGLAEEVQYCGAEAVTATCDSREIPKEELRRPETAGADKMAGT